MSKGLCNAKNHKSVLQTTERNITNQEVQTVFLTPLTPYAAVMPRKECIMPIRLLIFTILFSMMLALAQGSVHESRSFESEALGGTVNYSIYLPAGYDADTRAYPVVYMLHGYGGEDTDWIRYGNIAMTADRMIAEGALPSVIIAMPDAGNSYYVNSEEYGDYETALAEEFVTYMDSNYRTIADRSSRAIGGLSMGGYGAAYYALRHPDTFAAIGVMSGALFAEEPPSNRSQLTGDPFDEDVWAEHNVFENIEEAAASEQRCGWPPPSEKCLSFFINVGDDDQLGLHTDAVLFYNALVEAEFPAELRIHNGDHAWGFWAEHVDEVLAHFAATFARYY